MKYFVLILFYNFAFASANNKQERTLSVCNATTTTTPMVTNSSDASENSSKTTESVAQSPVEITTKLYEYQATTDGEISCADDAYIADQCTVFDETTTEPKQETTESTKEITKTTASPPKPTKKKMNTATKCPDAVIQIQRAMFKFSAQFLEQVANSTPKSIIALSAVPSVYFIGILKLRAVGETNKELSKVLTVFSNTQVRCALQKITKDKASLPSYVRFYNGYNLVANDQYPLSKDVKADMEKLIEGKAYNGNFENQQETADTLNANIEKQTNNQVRDVVSPNLINEMAEIALVSGSTYQSPWKFQINTEELRNFSVSPCENIQIPFYAIREIFNYTETADEKILSIEGANDETLVFVLPKIKFGSDGFLKKLIRNPEYVNLVTKTMKTSVITAYVPVINVSKTYDVMDIMKKQNFAPIIFNLEKAQFRDLVVGDPKVAVSIDIQKFNFENIAEGTLPPSTIPKQEGEIVFDLNSPFYWLTIYKETPYFIGKYARSNAV